MKQESKKMKRRKGPCAGTAEPISIKKKYLVSQRYITSQISSKFSTERLSLPFQLKHSIHKLHKPSKIDMRSAIVLLVAIVATVTASPAKVERQAPPGATVIPESCTLGAVSCHGVDVAKCGHAGLFLFPCGAGTHCEVPDGGDDPTCVADSE